MSKAPGGTTAATPRDPVGTGGSTSLGNAARSGVLNLAGAGVSAVLGLLLTLAVTRLFPVAVAGTFFVAMSVFLIAVGVAEVGAGVGMVYVLSRRRARGELSGLRAVFQVATPPVLAASAVVTTLVWFAGPWLVTQMAADDPTEATSALRAATVFIPAAVLFMLYGAAIRGLGRTRPFVVLERVTRPGLQLAAVAAVGLASAAGAGLVTVAWAAPYLLLVVAAMAWARRIRRRGERAGGVTSPASPTGADWREFWRFTTPRSLTGVAKMTLQRLDVILIAALLGPVPVALYVAASRFLVVGQLASQSLGHAVQHRFAALFATDQLPDARQLYQVTTGWLIVAAWPLFLLCVVLTEPILALFGEEYPAAAPVMRILSLTMLLAIACGIVSMVLEMAGRTVATLAQTLLALIANIVLNLVLIPRYGLVGAALAWAVAIAVHNLLPAAQLYRSYRMQPVGRSAVVAMITAASCFGVLPGVVVLLVGSGPGSLVISVAAGSTAYLAVLWPARRALQLDLLAALRRRPQDQLREANGRLASKQEAFDSSPTTDSSPSCK